MPIVKIEMLAGRSPQAKERIAAGITGLLAEELQVEAAHIYVMFTDFDHRAWAVGGKFFPVPEQDPGSTAGGER